jgi:dTDP-4-dehydrorhamnose 3,5-epimerase
MKFTETEILGAFIVELNKIEDQRGFFARMFCAGEFEAHGMDPTIAQINIGRTSAAGTLRGLHYQTEPFADSKLVRCTAGRIHDVCVDLRRDSLTFRQNIAVELSADDHRMLYLPPGCAHGYQALTDDIEIMYTTNMAYAPQNATGVRFDDQAFALDWPMDITKISEADLAWPDFQA